MSAGASGLERLMKQSGQDRGARAAVLPGDQHPKSRKPASVSEARVLQYFPFAPDRYSQPRRLKYQ